MNNTNESNKREERIKSLVKQVTFLENENDGLKRENNIFHRKINENRLEHLEVIPVPQKVLSIPILQKVLSIPEEERIKSLVKQVTSLENENDGLKRENNIFHRKIREYHENGLIECSEVIPVPQKAVFIPEEEKEERIKSLVKQVYLLESEWDKLEIENDNLYRTLLRLVKCSVVIPVPQKAVSIPILQKVLSIPEEERISFLVKKVTSLENEWDKLEIESDNLYRNLRGCIINYKTL